MKSEFVRNRAEFGTFWRQLFLGGGMALKYWDQDYKIEHTSDHVAKFHVDRPRELAVKKKKRKKHQQ